MSGGVDEPIASPGGFRAIHHRMTVRPRLNEGKPGLAPNGCASATDLGQRGTDPRVGVDGPALHFEFALRVVSRRITRLTAVGVVVSWLRIWG